MALSREREKLLGRLRHRKTREREALFLVEGVRAAGEALELKVPVRFAVVSPRLARAGGGEALLRRLEDGGVEVDSVTDAALEASADTEAPQGVLLVCAEPGWTLDDAATSGPGGARALLLDGVQDPGNLGTLVRAAAAFGVPAVVALEGTVDPWNAKAVRASAGGLFRTRVLKASWEEAGAWLDRERVTLLVGAADGADVACVERPPAWALAVGNEGAGPRPELVAAGRPVAVPMPGGSESLNAGVAGSILLYALTRETRGA